MEYEKLQNNISKGEILLKKVDIDGNICGEFVEFTISHVYENIGEDDVKGIYTFPIPDTAVISGFEANIGGSVIKGKVEDKKEIEKIYENIGEDSGSKLILEELNNNYFKMSIGTILKGETVVIKISYIEELVYEHSKLKLIIPKIVLPENPYNEEQSQQEDYKLSLNLLVETFESAKFSCNTHKIQVEEEEDDESNLYKITLQGEEQILDSAMSIYLEENSSETSGIIYENYSEDNGIVYLRFLPEIEEDVEEKNGNYIFLIDISESMEGDKLKEAKTALHLCLRNLYKGDTFNIVAMGDTLKHFSESRRVEFNDENLKEASKWIDKLACENDANIFDGIKYAFLNEDKGEENTIILFTDDVVDDEKDILDYVEKTCVGSRIFPFGIDASVNTYFINKIARITFGKAEFINRSIRIEDVILNQFNRIRGLQITDIEIDWGGMKVEKTYPRTIEYMYDGEPFSIFAKIDGDLEGIVTLNGMVGDRRIQRRIVLTKLDLEVNANLIEKVWYKKRIESLENRIVYERGEVHEAMKNKIIELSTDIGIISDETSFILIEEIYEPVLGGVMRKFLPVNIDFNKGDTNIISPKFYYSQSLDELQLENLMDEGIDKSEFLRVLATQQLASGAFGKSVEDTKIDKVIYTARSIVAFTHHGEGIEIYKNLLTKAVVYLVENYEEFVENEDVLILTYVALKSFADKVIVKDNKKTRLLNAINSLESHIEELNIDISKLNEEILSNIEGAKEKDQLSRLIYKSIKY